jgi:uncharacterized protein YkwD
MGTFRPAVLFAVSLTCAMLLMPVGAASAAGCPNETLIPNANNTLLISVATRCLINQERARFGRKPLAASAALNVPAQRFAQLMVSQRFFGHVGPEGDSVLLRVKRQSNYISKRTGRYALGENIAWGSDELGSPLQIVDFWMHSSGHRRNILDRTYRDVGIGVASGAPEDVGGDPAGTYSTVFGQQSKR